MSQSVQLTGLYIRPDHYFIRVLLTPLPTSPSQKKPKAPRLPLPTLLTVISTTTTTPHKNPITHSALEYKPSVEAEMVWFVCVRVEQIPQERKKKEERRKKDRKEERKRGIAVVVAVGVAVGVEAVVSRSYAWWIELRNPGTPAPRPKVLLTALSGLEKDEVVVMVVMVVMVVATVIIVAF